MKFVFVDEFKGKKDKKIFGLSLILIDSNHYCKICDDFASAIRDLGWPEDKEFKGKYIFSGYSDDSTNKKLVEVEDTIDFVKGAIDFLSGNTNSKCEVVSVYNNKGQTFDNYCELLSLGILKLKKYPQNRKSYSSGKNSVCLFYDGFNEGWKKNGINRISEVASGSFFSRNYFLVEKRATPVDSHNSCVGVCYADILAHLIAWKIETPDFAREEISQKTLFDGENEFTSSDIQLKKIATVKDIIKLVKDNNLNVYDCSS